MATSVENVKRGKLGGIGKLVTRESVQLAMKAVAALPGDPLTRTIAKRMAGCKVTRASATSWNIVDRAGTTYTATVSGNSLTIKGPNGTSTSPLVHLPHLSLPSLPKAELGKWMNGIADAAVASAMKLSAPFQDALLRRGIHARYPNARITEVGKSTWSVSNAGQPPYTIQIKGNAITASREGHVLATEAFTAANLASALKRIVSGEQVG